MNGAYWGTIYILILCCLAFIGSLHNSHLNQEKINIGLKKAALLAPAICLCILNLAYTSTLSPDMTSDKINQFDYMKYIIGSLLFIHISLAFIFSEDIKKTSTNIIDNRFFLSLISLPLTIGIALAIPISANTDFLFTVDGYKNFLEYFALPLTIIGIGSTIGAVYGFIHTSKQKERDTSILRSNIDLQTSEAYKSTLEKQIISASAITVTLIKITNNVSTLGKRLVGKSHIAPEYLKHDISIIDNFWNGFYQEEKYLPAIIEFNKQLQDLDGYMKGLITLTLQIISVFPNQALKLPENEKFKSLESKFTEVCELLHEFEREVVKYNQLKRDSWNEWNKYTEELKVIIRQE